MALSINSILVAILEEIYFCEYLFIIMVFYHIDLLYKYTLFAIINPLI